MDDHSPCLLCPIYRPRARPRTPRRPPVCDADRRRLAVELTELTELYERLAQPDSALPDPTRPARPDPLAPLGGAAPVPGRSRRPRVSGSRTPGAPISLDRLDLTMPARPAPGGPRALGFDPDQAGQRSAATVLAAWVRDWCDTLLVGPGRPDPSVPGLVGWLHHHLDRACNQHPAIEEFAAEIRELRAALRRALGEPNPPAETLRYEGTACRHCDLRAVLLRRPGDEYVECGNCGTVFTEDELAQRSRTPVTRETTSGTPDQVKTLRIRR